MAMGFRAATDIRHGVADENGAQTKVVEFKKGDLVTGLSKADMAQLWNAGALEQVEVVDKPSDDSSGGDTSKTAGEQTGSTAPTSTAKTTDLESQSQPTPPKE